MSTMAQPTSSTWGDLWDKAAAKYKAQQDAYEKDHQHWWKGNQEGKKREDAIPELTTAAALDQEVNKQREAFERMRQPHKALLDSLVAIGLSLETMMNQAAQVSGAFFPGGPIIFGAVWYLFRACIGVSGYFDVIEQLFENCTRFINNILIYLRGSKSLHAELEPVIISSLVKFLDVCRITTAAVQERRLKAWFENLYRDKGGEAKTALNDLEKLAKERDSTVEALTLRYIDNIEADLTEVKNNVIEVKTNVVEVKSGVVEIKRAQRGQEQMLLQLLTQTSQQAERRRGKDVKDPKQVLEERNREDLRLFLNPDLSVSDRLKELQNGIKGDTCQWILKRPEFEAWIAGQEPSILVISGNSGVGKSHLAASIARHLGDQYILGDDGAFKASFATYFCDFEDLDDRETYEKQANGNVELGHNEGVQSNVNGNINDKSESPEADWEGVGSEIETQGEYDDENSAQDIDTRPLGQILRTLAWQLTQGDKVYEKSLAVRKKEVKTVGQIWERLFNNKYFEELQKPVFLIIDGLDTLPLRDRKAFYSLLKDLTQVKEGTKKLKLKIVVLGRPRIDKEIRKCAGEPNILYVTVSEVENGPDIEKFITQSLTEPRKLQRMMKDQAFREETVKKLGEAAKGGFELAALMVKELLQKDHTNVFSETLKYPQRKVADILLHTLEYFGQTHTAEDIDDLNRLLAWVLYSFRPLTLAELNAATGIESSQGEFLDIRDKLEREFSAYFTIIDVSQSTKDYIKQEAFHFGEAELVEAPDNGTWSDDGGSLVQQFPADVDDATLAAEKATVKLSHSSIAKFFRYSDKIEIKEKDTVIGVSRVDAHLRLAKICLKAICSIGSDYDVMSRGLMDYAISNLHKHLDELRGAPLLREDKIEIANYLIQMFRDDTILETWVAIKLNDFWPEWYTTQGLIGVFWRSISDEDVREGLAQEDLAWITDTKVSSAERLLRPLTIFIAKKWLEGIDLRYIAIGTYFHVANMIKLVTKTEEEAMKEPGEADPQIVNPKPDFIRNVADWTQLEKTAMWHSQLAKVVRFNSSKDAIEEYQKALERDEEFGAAHFGLAIVHGELGNYDLAIDEMREAHRLQFIEESESNIHAAVWISRWQQAADRTNDALQTLEEDLSKRPNIFTTIVEYIALLSKLGRCDGLMSALKGLGEELPNFLISDEAESVRRIIRASAQVAKRTDFIKSAYEAAIRRARLRESDEAVWTLRRELQTIYAENEEENRAIKESEEIFQHAETFGKQDWQADYDAGLLCELYFTAAYTSAEGSWESKRFVAKLTRMEEKGHLPDSKSLSAAGYYAGLYLGLLNRLQEKLDEARPYFKERIAHAMTILEDDDISNDIQAWEILQSTLFMWGDEVNGKAALGIRNAVRLDGAVIADMGDDDKGPALAEDNTSNGELTNGRENTVANEEKVGTRPSIKVGSEDKTATAVDGSVTVVVNSALVVKAADGNTAKQAQQKDDIKEERSFLDGSQSESSKPTEEHEETSSELQATVPATENDLWDETCYLFGFCDGPCLRSFDKTDIEVYYCTYCFDTQICVNCFDLFHKGLWLYKKCDLSHKHTLVHGPPKGLLLKNSSEVKVGDEVKDRAQWLDEMRRAWDLPVKPEEKGKEALAKRDEAISKGE